MAKEKKYIKIVIGPVRFSYLHVWEAIAMEKDSVKKFSVSLIIPKTDTETIKKIKAGIQEAAEGLKVNGKLPAKWWNPLCDGDSEKPEDEAYANSYYISAKANENRRPTIVNVKREAIIDRDDIKSGDYGYASITLFMFNEKMNGVGAGLNHLMKTKDGEALSGGSSADEDFADIEVGSDDFLN